MKNRHRIQSSVTSQVGQIISIFPGNNEMKPRRRDGNEVKVDRRILYLHALMWHAYKYLLFTKLNELDIVFFVQNKNMNMNSIHIVKERIKQFNMKE